jgi:hypothetical protein
MTFHSNLYPELGRLSFDQLRHRFSAEPPDPEESGVYYGEVAASVAQHGWEGLNELLAHAADPDEDRARAALLGLGFVSGLAPEREAAFLQALDETRPLVIAEALQGLTSLPSTAGRARSTVLLGHESPYVRAAAGRYIAHVWPEAAPVVLYPQLHDADYRVRESAIDALDEAGLIAAAPLIEPLLRDPHPDVRQAAQTALEHLHKNKT